MQEEEEGGEALTRGPAPDSGAEPSRSLPAGEHCFLLPEGGRFKDVSVLVHFIVLFNS